MWRRDANCFRAVTGQHPMTNRISRWFPNEPDTWLQSRETNLLLQDFNLSIVPHRDHGDAYELSVEGLSNNDVKEALSFRNSRDGPDSFVKTIASTLLTEHEAWLEVAYTPDDRNGIPFRSLLVHGVRRTATGNLIQESPVQDVSNHQPQQDTTQEPQITELDDERMVHICLPNEYPNQLLTKLTEELVETDTHDPLLSQWIMDGMIERNRDTPAIDSREASRTKRLRTVQAALPIGWTAREIYYGSASHLTEYYYFWRELRFLHFRSSMRERAEEGLIKVLNLAGAECGFKLSVVARGLYTPSEVEEIIREYATGKVTLTTVSDIIFERAESPYSRERQLF